MKLLAIVTSLISVAFTLINAAGVTYSVIAFPGPDNNVSVSVDGHAYPLRMNPTCPNIYTGVAPSGTNYQYAISTSSGELQLEDAVRELDEGVTNTGHEFFDRSRTTYHVPSLPRAYSPIYTPLASGMDRDNEISTLIINADMDALDVILKSPTDDHKYAQVYDISYISHDAVYNFKNAGIKNSGQSSKDKAKQSLKIKFNKYSNSDTKDTLFGRHAFKLRAGATDPTLMREKLMMDSLTAAGVATLGSNWVRVFINEEPFGLYLMMDDSFKGFTDNLINGGNSMSSTGVTIKCNAMSPSSEANLVYKGPDVDSYDSNNVYILEDTGNDPAITKENYMVPLVDFMERLSNTVVGSDSETPGTITDLMDSAEHTMIHAAMSFLSGSWDGLWYQASNFYLNQNTDTKKWYVITYDFDETFGNGVEDSDLMTVPYESYSRHNSHRPLIDIFIKSAYYEPKFQNIIKRLVQRFYNPRVIRPRLVAWVEMLKEDIAWDRSLPFRSPGDKERFTVGDLNNAFTTVGSRIGVLEWISNRTASVCDQLDFTY